MNRQMTLAEMNDEFGAARTNKKEFRSQQYKICISPHFTRMAEQNGCGMSDQYE